MATPSSAFVRKTLARAGVVLSLLAAGIGVPQSALAAPSAPGPDWNACLFFAPRGFEVVKGVKATAAGHVAWAVRNGSQDSWLYGSDDGVVLEWKPRTWVTGRWWMSEPLGSWQDVLNEFRNGKHNTVGPRFYRTFRCGKVAHPNFAAANAVGVSYKKNGTYYLADRNCLTKAVAVLRAYGAALDSPSYAATPVAYFGKVAPTALGHYRRMGAVKLVAEIRDPVTKAYVTTNPRSPYRKIFVEFVDGMGRSIGTMFTIASAVRGTSKYEAVLELEGSVDWDPGGDKWLLKVRLDNTLKRTAGIVALTNDDQVNAPLVSLVVGDIDQNNAITIADFQVLMRCYSDLTPAKGPCSTDEKQRADLNDDGAVNQFDYNLFLRVMKNPQGA